MYKKHVSVHINNQTKSQEREKNIYFQNCTCLSFQIALNEAVINNSVMLDCSLLACGSINIDILYY